MTDFASMYFGDVASHNISQDFDNDTYFDINATLHNHLKRFTTEIFDLSSSDDPVRDPLYLVIPITILYALIFLAGVIGNISTCIVIVRNKCMHTATNYYLFSLAISDLILLLSGLPPDVYTMWYPETYVFGEASCVLIGLSSEMSANATVLTITAFTVERYIAICHPFLSHTMSKLSRVVKFIIAIWILALCLAIPQAIQFGVVVSSVGSSCTVKWVMVEHAFEISGFVFFVGPMTVITVLYVLIGIKLRTSRLLQPPKKCSFNSNLDHHGSARSYKNCVSQSRAIKMLVAVAVSFFLCWAPFHAQRLLAVYGKNTDKPSRLLTDVYKVLTYLSGVLYFLSTTINPFLYNIMSNKFREAFKNTIAQKCCGSRHRGRGGCRDLPPRPRGPSTGSRLTTLTCVRHCDNNNARNPLVPHPDVTANPASDLMKHGADHRASSDKPKHVFSSFADRVRKSTSSVFKLTGENEKNSYEGPETPNRKRLKSDSLESISKSSLQDIDEEEFSGRELATFMGQVNNHIVDTACL